MKQVKCLLLILAVVIINGCASQPGKLLKSAELSIIHGHDDIALEQINQAIEIDPTAVASLQARAHLYLRMNRRQNAIADLGKIIEIDPQSVQTYMTRGIIYSSDGITDRALKDFRKACELGDESGCIFSKELEKK